MQNVTMETPRNAGRPKRSVSSIGRSCIRSTTTKATRRAPPPIRLPRIRALLQPLEFPRSSPKTIRKSAADRVSSPQMSARTARSSRDSFIRLSATQRANAPTGTFTKKTQRQPRVSVRIPPTSGPEATAAPIVARQSAIAPPRSGPRYSWPISASAVAKRAAPPTPWIARATSRATMFQARPQSSDAPVKTTTPTMKRSLRPKRSARAPAVRMSAASVRAYASTTHSSPVRPACSCRWMLGSATFTIVMSSSNMNVVVQTATRVHRRAWASPSMRRDATERKRAGSAPAHFY